jgi:hypothetical protein
MRAGEHDPHPLGLLREEPRIADVAVEGGLEVQQKESDFVHFAPEVLARQAVCELVNRRHRQHRDPCEQQRVESVQPSEIANDLVPVADRDCERDDDGRQRKCDEPFGEEELDISNDAIEQAIGIECLEPDIEQVAPDAVGVAAGLCLIRLEKSEAAQMLDELVDDFQRRRNAKRLFELLRNRLDCRVAVELSGNEVLRFAEAKEAARNWILDDEDRAFLAWLRAYL